MKKAICISGSVATGKTTFAKGYAKKNKLIYTDVKEIIKKYKLDEEYDDERDCAIIEIKKLNKILIELIKASKTQLVIDSHLSHELPQKYVEKVIITTCELKELKKRLKKRGYSEKKIKENLEAEIFEICKTEAEENGHIVEIIHTDKQSKGLNIFKHLKRR